tara:strand:+ start:96 stop:482 length:387 start_codon:yes stop_codon:yes gene_type:complete
MSNVGGRVNTVRFPVKVISIKCPICDGKECNVCNQTGELELDGPMWVEVQEPHIIKWIKDNAQRVSFESSRMYGITPTVETLTVSGKYQVISVNSIMGAVFIITDLNNKILKYFYNKKEMKKWLAKEK